MDDQVHAIRYTCDKCHGWLRPGVSACPHCWAKFKASVVPRTSDADRQATMQSKVPIDEFVKKLFVLTPFLLVFDLLCYGVSGTLYHSVHTQRAGENFHIIASAADGYEADHAMTYPPTDTMAHFQSALAPYISADEFQGDHLDSLFEETHAGPYILNKDLSRKPVNSVRDPADVFLAREPEPQEGDDVMVVFADGSVHWTRLSSIH